MNRGSTAGFLAAMGHAKVVLLFVHNHYLAEMPVEFSDKFAGVGVYRGDAEKPRRPGNRASGAGRH